MSHILEAENLQVTFSGDRGKQISVDNVSFYVNPGEVLCLVGESGCGKSVTSLAIMGLLGRGGKVTGGKIFFKGENLLELGRTELDRIRGNALTMIFQDPLSSLNPVLTIGQQLREGMQVHMKLSRQESEVRARQLLVKAGLRNAPALMKKYPHELSGGMRQRVMIAMALSCNPSLLIADEPTTALDVTIQAQIMALLKQLAKEMHMSLLLITHDMGVVAQMADRVMVMYAGQMIEQASVLELFDHPAHPYTKALLEAVPSLETGWNSVLKSIEGRVPEDYGDMAGCRFASRCPYRQEACEQPQKEENIAPSKEDIHLVRCMRAISLQEGDTHADNAVT